LTAVASTARLRWAVGILALALFPGRAIGQTQTTPPAEPPLMDVWDQLREWRHKPPPPEDDKTKRRLAVTAIPLISAKPPQGLRLGAGASLEFPLGDPAVTRISSINTGGFISVHKQVGVSITPTIFGGENRWQLVGDNHFQQTSSINAALGAGAQSDGLDVNYSSVRSFNTYSHRIGQALYPGIGLFYARQTDIRAPDDQAASFDQSAVATYSREHGFDLASQTAAGLGVSLTYDNRDNQNDARRGWFAAATYRSYMKGFLGGDSNWQRVSFDVRTYVPLARPARQRLALWSYSDFVTSGVPPYLSLPMIGGDTRGRSGRGYAEGQLRGDRFVYAEAEYRASLMANGLVGMVVFVNASTVAYPPSSIKLFDSVAAGGGAGLRLLLQKRSRTHLCLDFGFGQKGSHGVYIGLADAF